MKQVAYILYIEDEREMIYLVGKLLQPYDYKLMGATSGKQGLVMMQERQPDVLLLDLMMHDTNGWDVYRQMKQNENLANIPVIVITAKSLADDHKISEDLPPVEAYIPKPFDPKRLIQTIQDILKK